MGGPKPLFLSPSAFSLLSLPRDAAKTATTAQLFFGHDCRAAFLAPPQDAASPPLAASASSSPASLVRRPSPLCSLWFCNIWALGFQINPLPLVTLFLPFFDFFFFILFHFICLFCKLGSAFFFFCNLVFFPSSFFLYFFLSKEFFLYLCVLVLHLGSAHSCFYLF